MLSKEYDHTCDIWSCGVILYMLLAGTPPFYKNTREETIELIKAGKVEYPRMHRSARIEDKFALISVHAQNLLQQMLAYEPHKRITPEAALKHPWLQNRAEDTQTDTDLRLALKHLKDFNTQLTLQKAVLTYFVTHQLKPEEETRLRELFDNFDADKDGRLNLNDLIIGYQRVYKDAGKARAEAEKILRKADMNHNGIIDYTGMWP